HDLEANVSLELGKLKGHANSIQVNNIGDSTTRQSVRYDVSSQDKVLIYAPIGEVQIIISVLEYDGMEFEYVVLYRRVEVGKLNEYSISELGFFSTSGFSVDCSLRNSAESAGISGFESMYIEAGEWIVARRSSKEATILAIEAGKETLWSPQPQEYLLPEVGDVQVDLPVEDLWVDRISVDVKHPLVKNIQVEDGSPKEPDYVRLSSRGRFLQLQGIPVGRGISIVVSIWKNDTYEWSNFVIEGVDVVKGCTTVVQKHSCLVGFRDSRSGYVAYEDLEAQLRLNHDFSVFFEDEEGNKVLSLYMVEGRNYFVRIKALLPEYDSLCPSIRLPLLDGLNNEADAEALQLAEAWFAKLRQAYRDTK
ncbi:MAG: hypothetical protein KDB07_13685, partial [Planctomycetes bacterium]|nr:hypothetical protein [Planctomycetota bacterium]